jgi:transketolase
MNPVVASDGCTKATLQRTANALRRNILTMVCAAGSGHPGGSLSAADIVTVLYFDEMNIDPKNPSWPDRDRFILSKGHACPVLYATLVMKGYCAQDQLYQLRKLGSIFQGHPVMHKTPGVDYTTGSLGNGLSIGVGIALAAKLDRKSYRTYVLLSDGELDEGMVWEALMAAVKFKADNLCAIIDHNHLQLDGPTDEVMPVEPLREKLESFNWHVVEIDGHDIADIQRGLAEARHTSGRPTVLIAETVKGKGVSFMENQCDWHGAVLSEAQLTQALRELERSDEELP